jgi:hypothetical protein
MRFGEGLTVMCLLACITCSAQHMATPTTTSGNEQGQVTPSTVEGVEIPPSRAHGTIVVIVAAQNGYALAADSRLTVEDGRGHVLEKRDDGQKLFPVGKFTACVVAGNVSSAALGDGFVLEASVATDMALVARSGLDMDARRFTDFFQVHFNGILGLLDPDVTVLQNPVFGMSAVSFRPDGGRQWVSYYQNFAVKTDFAGRKYFSTGEVTPIPEPASKVVAIGAPFWMVDALISLDGPTEAFPFTSTLIMRRYFELKKAGHLDKLSLSEAEQLAAGLVEDTVNRAPEADGVGGPIDVATLSSDGFRWIARKQNVAPLTPIFQARFIDAFADGGGQPLDGFECVRCTFRNTTFTFKGKADFRLVQPIFRDECKVNLDADAKNKMPQAVERIRRAMGARCKIMEVSGASAGLADHSK